jgi:competence protein ComFC
LVPVPLSPERERERGYNPAALLADEISIKTGIPVKPVIHKVRSTPPQMSLTREERFKNPKGAYETQGGSLAGKIILVDDVFTTGSTLEECARVLKKAGAAWVGAVVFGRTPRHIDNF